MNCHLNMRLYSHRRRWVVLLVIIALHASCVVLAHDVSPSDSAVIPPHDSDETLLSSGARNQTPRGEYANPEIIVAVADHKSQCNDTLFSTEDELLTASTHTFKANSSRQEHESDCQKELANAIAGRLDLMQASKSLEEKIERMEKDYAQVLNETWTDMELLEDKVKHQTRALKSIRSKEAETRKKMFKLDAELRRMHAAARKKYLNLTLVREDAVGFIEQTVSKASRRAEKRWTIQHRRLKPHIQDAKRRYIRFRRETKPKIMALKRKMQKHWSRSKTLRPILEMCRETITTPARAMYRHIEATTEGINVASRLSITSFIEETSKLALVYLEREDKKPKEESVMERERKRREQRMRRRSNLHHNDRQEEKETKPSRANLKARRLFEYTSTNAELLCEKGMALMPLAVGLSVARSGIVGGFSLFCGIPTPFIWIFVLIRVIRMSKVKKDKAL